VVSRHAPSIVEKGGARFEGITLLLCENPLPPLEAAIEAAAAELPRSNHYTEPFSAPLRRAIADQLGIAEHHIHVNAGSELILRQLFDRLGTRARLLTPTYALFPEIAPFRTETPLPPEEEFAFDLARLDVPEGTTLVAIVNPNNPTGSVFDMTPLPALLRRHPDTHFLVDEAFIEFAGESVTSLVPSFRNLVVTRTFSKAHSLAGFRVGYAVASEELADALNAANDAYPLARASQAAALATVQRMDEVHARVEALRNWTQGLAGELRNLGIRVYPTETYFFLADFSPVDGRELARALEAEHILVKPLADLGPGFVRMTTSTPENNATILGVLAELLPRLRP
jgi:histidinol-phosphate aminotransferase